MLRNVPSPYYTDSIKDLEQNVWLKINLLHTVIQGIPNHWEFRVSRRNLLKK